MSPDKMSGNVMAALGVDLDTAFGFRSSSTTHLGGFGLRLRQCAKGVTRTWLYQYNIGPRIPHRLCLMYIVGCREIERLFTARRKSARMSNKAPKHDARQNGCFC
jgi:hypothetical protein